MPSIYTPLSARALEALRINARRNRRTPQDQAAILIELALDLRRPEEEGDAPNHIAIPSAEVPDHE